MKTYAAPRVYRLIVEGELPERWQRWFEGCTLTRLDDGNTRITGVLDQAALHGLLARIRDLGIELIAVERE